MANRERNKRSVRQARAKERAAQEALQVASAPIGKESRATKQSSAAKESVPAKAAKPGLVGRAVGYLKDVRSEMRRVVWPSRSELTNYSVAVVIALVIFGVAVWAVDTGFVALLVAFTGLRG